MNDVAFALRKDPGGTGQGHNTNYVAAPLEAADGHHGYSSPRGDGADNLLLTGPLGGGNDGIGRRSEDDPNLIAQVGVRRLTPRECERLQALPDDWTAPTGTEPDSRRYAALGDAVTASVGEWLGRRIAAA